MILLDLRPLQFRERFHGIGRVTRELSGRLVSSLPEVYCLIEYSSVLPDIELPLQRCYPVYFGHEFSASGLIERYGSSESLLPYELLMDHYLTLINPKLYFSFCHITHHFPTPALKCRGSFFSAVIAYDLIPHIFADLYLKPYPVIEKWYYHKLNQFQRYDFYFAISECTKKDLVKHLNIPEESVIVIPLGCSEIFRPPSPQELISASWRILSRGLPREFILYVPSDSDPRKNIPRLIRAFALIPSELRSRFPLIIVSRLSSDAVAEYSQLIRELRLENQILFLGYVEDELLRDLYWLCALSVHPSLYEGFGLPVLEAMSCGAPVITSGNSATAELLDFPDAFFDPYDIESIARKIVMGLQDRDFNRILREKSLERAKLFTWERAVSIIIAELDRRNLL